MKKLAVFIVVLSLSLLAFCIPASADAAYTLIPSGTEFDMTVSDQTFHFVPYADYCDEHQNGSKTQISIADSWYRQRWPSSSFNPCFCIIAINADSGAFVIACSSRNSSAERVELNHSFNDSFGDSSDFFVFYSNDSGTGYGGYDWSYSSNVVNVIFRYSESSDYTVYYYFDDKPDCELYAADVALNLNIPFEGSFSLNSEDKTLDFEFNITSPDVLSAGLDNGIIVKVFDQNGDQCFQPISYNTIMTTDGKPLEWPEIYWRLIGDYLPNTYSWEYSTLRKVLSLNTPYTIKAYCHSRGDLVEFTSYDFSLTSAGALSVSSFSDLGAAIAGHSHIAENSLGQLVDTDTGEIVSDDLYGYTFNYSTDIDDPTDIDVEVSSFTFSDLPASLTQGAGFVRWLFDRLVNASGLGGFMVSVISLAVASWFLFGRML